MRKKAIALACASIAGLCALGVAGGLAFSNHTASVLGQAAAAFGSLSGAHGASIEARPEDGGILSRRGRISVFRDGALAASFKYEGYCLPFVFRATLKPEDAAARKLLARAGARSLFLSATPLEVGISTGRNDASGIDSSPLIENPRGTCDAKGLEASVSFPLSEAGDLEKAEVSVSADYLRCYLKPAEGSAASAADEASRHYLIRGGEFRTQGARIAEAGWKLPPYFSYTAAEFENTVPPGWLGGSELPMMFKVRKLSGFQSRLDGGRDGFATGFVFGSGVLSSSVRINGEGDRITGPDGMKGVKRGSYAIELSGPAFAKLPQLPDLVKAGYVRQSGDYRWTTRLDIERRMDSDPPEQKLRLNGIDAGASDLLAFLTGRTK